MSRTVMSPIAVTVTIPATGTASEMVFRDTLTIRNGLIIQSHLEFDAAELRRRLTEGALSKV